MSPQEAQEEAREQTAMQLEVRKMPRDEMIQEIISLRNSMKERGRYIVWLDQELLNAKSQLGQCHLALSGTIDDGTLIEKIQWLLKRKTFFQWVYACLRSGKWLSR